MILKDEPIDWDQFGNEIDTIIDDATTRTDDKLASRVSSLTRMTDEEVKELFPEPADVKKLTELLTIVNDAADRNTKINNIISNSEKIVSVILTLLQKYV